LSPSKPCESRLTDDHVVPLSVVDDSVTQLSVSPGSHDRSY